MKTGGADGSETGLVIKTKWKQNSMTGIGASLTLDYKDKDESNNIYTCHVVKHYSYLHVTITNNTNKNYLYLLRLALRS